MFNWLSAGSLFFNMAGNFIRLVQSVSLVVQERMLPIVLGPPPQAAQEITDELKDYMNTS